MNKREYFASPVYDEIKPEWLEKLDKLCDPYIKEARDDQIENNEKFGVQCFDRHKAWSRYKMLECDYLF